MFDLYRANAGPSEVFAAAATDLQETPETDDGLLMVESGRSEVDGSERTEEAGSIFSLWPKLPSESTNAHGAAFAAHLGP